MPDMAMIAQTLSIWGIPVLLAITLHEAAHGFAAKKFGDSTAYALGRMTLNPLKHIDPLGTLVLPLILVLTNASFLFGYAKLVPVNFNQLKPQKLGMALVALAGPAANLLLVVLSLPFLYVAVNVPPNVGQFIFLVAHASVQINLVLMVFNLLPIPPLDGGRVIQSFLPAKYSYILARYEMHGMVLVLILAFTGILFKIIGPMLAVAFAVVQMFYPVLG